MEEVLAQIEIAFSNCRCWFSHRYLQNSAGQKLPTRITSFHHNLTSLTLNLNNSINLTMVEALDVISWEITLKGWRGNGLRHL